MRAEIISIGTELLLGETVDTNASYLASELAKLGIELGWVSEVGDDQSRLVEVLKRAWGRSDIVLASGGLGPTGDDLTREAVAEMLGETMAVEPSLETSLRQRFATWNMTMPLSNLKQATLIPSAKPIANPQGTAPGWWVERDGHTLIAMPGPPREMYEMWQKQVQPVLRQKSKSVILPRTFKTFGLSEAAVGELVSPLLATSNPTLGIYAKPDGIYVRIAARAESQEQAEKLASESETSIRRALGDYIWGIDDDTLEKAVGHLLADRGLNFALAEDYSGGWLTASITDIPHHPVFFKGGLVVASGEAKTALGVTRDTILRYGSPSPEVAQAMAEAVKAFFKADIGISINGIQETKERPVGVVYIGIAFHDVKKAVTINARGKRRATTTALVELRKLLLSPE